MSRHQENDVWSLIQWFRSSFPSLKVCRKIHINEQLIYGTKTNVYIWQHKQWQPNNNEDCTIPIKVVGGGHILNHYTTPNNVWPYSNGIKCQISRLKNIVDILFLNNIPQGCMWSNLIIILAFISFRENFLKKRHQQSESHNWLMQSLTK